MHSVEFQPIRGAAGDGVTVRDEVEWGKIRTKNPDDAARQVEAFPHSWQCRFRTLGNRFKIIYILLFLFYLCLTNNKLLRKWVKVQLIIQ